MKRYSCCFGLCAVLLLAGCARNNPSFDRTVHVRGTVVQSGGAPLPGGRITFHPKDLTKGDAWAMIGSDGRFELGTYAINDGAIPGSYTVTIEPMFFDKNGNPRPLPDLNLAPKYKSAETSDLTMEIEDKDNQDIKVELR